MSIGRYAGIALIALHGSTLWLVAQNTAAQADAPWIEATMALTTPRIYEHSKFTITLSVRSRNIQLGQRFNMSGLPPDSVLRFTNFRDLPIQRTKEKGLVTEVRRFRIDVEALKAGQAQIAPQLRFQVLSRQKGGFFGHFTQINDRQLKVRPLRVNVLAIPRAGRPDNYSGAIGEFDFKLLVSPTQVEVEELVKVTLEISGEGYIDDVVWPELAPGRHFKLYPRKIQGNIKDGITLSQTIIPQTTNATHIPQMSFCYFDTKKGKYIDSRQGPVDLFFHSKTASTATVRYTPGNNGAVEGVSENPSAPRSRAGNGATDSATARASLKRTVSVTTTGIAGLCGLVSVVYFLLSVKARKQDQAVSTRHRRAGLVTLTAAVALSACSAGFYRSAVSGKTTRTLTRNISAYLGPSAQGIALFDTPQDSRVEVLETAGIWARIRYLDNSGWILRDALSADDAPE